MENKTKKYLTAKEVSSIYNISINTLRKWRCEQRGLPFIAAGRTQGRTGTILYPVDKVEEYFHKQLVNI